MTGESHDVGARLRALVIDGDLTVLRAHLDTLEGDDLKAARRWVAATHDVDGYPGPAELGDPADPDRYVRVQRVRLARLVAWGRVGAPAATAKAVAAEGTFLTAEQVLELVPSSSSGPGRARVFAAAVDAVPPTARGAGMAYVLLRAVVVAHRLPVPTGRNFHGAWIRELRGHADPPTWATDRAPSLDPLLADPLLPDVVYHQLASGEVGTWTGFGDVLPALVDKALIDRERTVAVALEQLTAGQRPSSQKVLAGVLTALDLRAEGVPGGLDYLLSVLSSCHGSATAPVLGLAIDLVLTGGDAVELARVIAPRAQKGVRRTLLRALAPGALGTRIDHAALLEAVDVLADGDDDATEQARYAKARAALGVVVAPETAVNAPASLGLWELEPTFLASRPYVPAGLTVRDIAKQLMRARNKGREQYQATEIVLDALARDTLTTWDLVGVAHELDAEGRLSPARSASFFEALFLGGAIRLAWPAAVRTAALAATGRPRPGLDRLLAMLCSYAAEPPRPVRLPSQVMRLAGGTTKAALEADRLVRLVGAETDPRTRTGWTSRCGTRRPSGPRRGSRTPRSGTWTPSVAGSPPARTSGGAWRTHAAGYDAASRSRRSSPSLPSTGSTRCGRGPP